ncbi:MAG: diaminopimelate epimerase [Streptosporangiales bacterium]|nr:diaminopimelate epimerase [Streptosporangiales bacterium]
MRFVKGHGTENTFIVVPDPEGTLTLSPRLVAALCDPRRGVGADGVLRVVRTKAVPEVPEVAELADEADEAEWFMDYRNADGSTAEMCGNGLRVYARYLVDAGLVPSGELHVATRDGLRWVTLGTNGDVTVDVGPVEVLGAGRASIAGRTYDGLRLRAGTPHLACVLGEPVADVDLTRPPTLDTGQFPDGANVELICPLAENQIEMRVHERGVGETRSCGTGAVAAAVAAAHAAGTPGGAWTVRVPGGRLQVTLTEAGSLLSGPAVLVAEGQVRREWLDTHG